MPEEQTLTKGEKTRAAIIEAAHKVFLQKGFHGASMRDIAEEAGLALGGIYNYFETKEAVFGVVLDAYHPYHHVLPALEQTQGETIEEFVHQVADKLREEIEGVEDQLLPLVFIDLVEFRGRHIKRVAAKIIPSFLVFVQRFRTRQGKLRKVSLPLMMRTLMAIIVGYFLSEMLFKDLPLAKNTLSAASFDQMIDIYLHGILQD